ncbi:hypothetical protein PFISCL1PPCAC_8731, partial [Pristionchus fissidentatus]
MAYSYQYLLVSDIGNNVFHVQLNRPKQLNAMNMEFLSEIGDVFTRLDTDSECRVIILSGAGRAFTAGLDLPSISASLVLEDTLDIARKGRVVDAPAQFLAHTFSSIEKCCKPVIAAVHAICIGGGIDLISACDIRYCTSD